jgi:predicted metal-dependent phosphoesterase TrpH
MCTVPGLSRVCRESYNDPLEIYLELKRRGMDLVTVTDHNSIDAASALQVYPDFFISEELTCTLPSGGSLHVGVYDIRERDHIELQRRRDDFESLVSYLLQRGIFFSVNHPFAGITGSRHPSDFDDFADFFPAIEVRNGHIGIESNEAAEELATLLGKVAIAGSDAHSMSGLGTTFTSVPQANSKQEFFAGLRRGHAVVSGEHGNAGKLACALSQIAVELICEKAWTAALLPLILALPAAAVAVCLRDRVFARYWRAHMRARFPLAACLNVRARATI